MYGKCDGEKLHYSCCLGTPHTSAKLFFFFFFLGIFDILKDYLHVLINPCIEGEKSQKEGCATRKVHLLATLVQRLCPSISRHKKHCFDHSTLPEHRDQSDWTLRWIKREEKKKTRNKRRNDSSVFWNAMWEFTACGVFFFSFTDGTWLSVIEINNNRVKNNKRIGLLNCRKANERKKQRWRSEAVFSESILRDTRFWS